MTVQPFEIEDAGNVALREQDLWLTSWIPSQAVLHKEHGIGFTVRDEEGTIAMCIGADILWKGVGEVWALIGLQYAAYRFTMQKIVAKILEGLFTVYQFHRLQAPIPASNYQSIRFAMSHKFQKEGTMRQFDSAKIDYIMFARVA